MTANFLNSFTWLVKKINTKNYYLTSLIFTFVLLVFGAVEIDNVTAQSILYAT
jgi:hypothetical protein